MSALSLDDLPVPGVMDLCLRDDRLSGHLEAPSMPWPLRDDSVDRVVLQHVLETAPDVEGLLDEALRVLKPEREIAVLVVGALGWTRWRLHLRDAAAPSLRIHPTRMLLEALAARDCVDLRVSRVDFDGDNEARIAAPARLWSGVYLIEARKRRVLPHQRRVRVRRRVIAPVGWVARPASRRGLAA